MEMDKKRVLLVFGTRPEAIKMAPVARAIAATPELDLKICVTAQHRQMLDQVLELFEIKADFDLNLMRPGQDLTDITSRVLSGMRDVFAEWRPDIVLVHGDTTTTMAAAIASFYARIPVAHVEAGLRTHNLQSPWPEELNRRIAGIVTALHFAPTATAKNNLLNEGIAEKEINVTGNTVIDALFDAMQILDKKSDVRTVVAERFSFLNKEKRLVLVTGHRRENFGEGFQQICRALKEIAADPTLEVVYPVHLNPNVQRPVSEILGDAANVHLIEPLDYLPFVYLMGRAHIILTDSGGVQEEAPSLGKPVLVMRDTTERPEAVEAGTVKLVGAEQASIVTAARELLGSQHAYDQMARAVNPYGDGKASAKIAASLVEWFKAQA
jgi:UDP-N-acetylglucosamine 2-epimerase (non-hydrolysing)